MNGKDGNEKLQGHGVIWLWIMIMFTSTQSHLTLTEAIFQDRSLLMWLFPKKGQRMMRKDVQGCLLFFSRMRKATVGHMPLHYPSLKNWAELAWRMLPTLRIFATLQCANSILVGIGSLFPLCPHITCWTDMVLLDTLLHVPASKLPAPHRMAG